jgi:hypothetical protein
MRRNAKRLVPVGLGIGLVLAGLSTAALWRQEFASVSRALPAREVNQAAEDSARHPMPGVLEALAELQRVQVGQGDVAQRSDVMRRELAVLRSQLLRVDRAQELSHQELPQIARAGLVGGHAAEALALTPAAEPTEDKPARAEAQARARIEVLEGTMRVENADPEWASAAELALNVAFHKEARAGLRLRRADCRSSLCRLALVLDGTVSPKEIFQQLIDVAPWNGQGFVRIDKASGEAVVDLSREGHALPSSRES